MPVADCFLDTNILLYAVSTNPDEAGKTAKARALLQSANWAWSAQVAAEFVRAGTASRQAMPLTRAEARRWVELWMAFPMSVVDGALTETAVRLPFDDHARATDVPVPVGDEPPGTRGDELAVAADARTVGDLDGLLDARSPMLARAFQAARSRANGACG